MNKAEQKNVLNLIKTAKGANRNEAINNIALWYTRKTGKKITAAWMRVELKKMNVLSKLPLAKTGPKKIRFVKYIFIKYVKAAAGESTQQKALRKIAVMYGNHINKSVSSMWVLSRIKEMGILSMLPQKTRGRKKKVDRNEIIEGYVVVKESDINNPTIKKKIINGCKYDCLFDGYVIYNFGKGERIATLKEDDVSYKVWRDISTLNLGRPKTVEIYG